MEASQVRSRKRSLQLTNPTGNILPTSTAMLYMHRCHLAFVAINGACGSCCDAEWYGLLWGAVGDDVDAYTSVVACMVIPLCKTGRLLDWLWL